jgi:hypothetical protein
MYEFKVDLDGDAVEDLAYRFVFEPRDAAGDQAYVVRRLTGSDAADPHAAGEVIGDAVSGQSVEYRGRLLWAGKAGDPFWIDPDVLHAAGHAVHEGTVLDLSSWDPSKAKNLFAGHTVYSIVLEVPNDELAAATA